MREHDDWPGEPEEESPPQPHTVLRGPGGATAEFFGGLTIRGDLVLGNKVVQQVVQPPAPETEPGTIYVHGEVIRDDGEPETAQYPTLPGGYPEIKG